MEVWEIDAREQVRDLVASYNALGDRGRFDDLLALFAPDATMDVGDGRTYVGVDEIRTIFTETRDSVRGGDHAGDATDGTGDEPPGPNTSSTTPRRTSSPSMGPNRPPGRPTSRS